MPAIIIDSCSPCRKQCGPSTRALRLGLLQEVSSSCSDGCCILHLLQKTHSRRPWRAVTGCLFLLLLLLLLCSFLPLSLLVLVLVLLLMARLPAFRPASAAAAAGVRYAWMTQCQMGCTAAVAGHLPCRLQDDRCLSGQPFGATGQGSPFQRHFMAVRFPVSRVHSGEMP